MNALEQMLRMPRGRPRTEKEKAADAAAQEQGMTTGVDDKFTTMSIPDLEAELFSTAGLTPGPKIAVPGLTPEVAGYPIVRLVGTPVLSTGGSRQELDIALLDEENAPGKIIGGITHAEMALYPDYEALRRYIACKILIALRLPLPESHNLLDPPELVVEGCYSGFRPGVLHRLCEGSGTL